MTRKSSTYAVRFKLNGGSVDHMQRVKAKTTTTARNIVRDQWGNVFAVRILDVERRRRGQKGLR